MGTRESQTLASANARLVELKILHGLTTAVVETRPLQPCIEDHDAITQKGEGGGSFDDPGQAIAASWASNTAVSPDQGGRMSWDMRNAQKQLGAARQRVGLMPANTAVNQDCGPDWHALAEQSRAILQGAGLKQEEVKIAAQGVRTHPSLSLAALKAGKAVMYRIWLLARHFDSDGRGWVYLDDFKDAITADDSKMRVFTRQRAGQVLRAGDGEFWTFGTGRNGRNRLRYTGAAQLAAGLGLERLSGLPVILELETLTTNIGRFKAHLHASFHAGRVGKRGEGKPISRAVQEDMTGHSTRTLQRYDRRARVGKKANYVLSSRYTAEEAQEQAWKHGHASFEFTDYKGKQGRSGDKYVARQLPNSYVVDMPTSGRSSSRKINRYLTHPRQIGGRGAAMMPIFHDDPAAAAKAFNRCPDSPCYWPYRAGPIVQFWGELWMK